MIQITRLKVSYEGEAERAKLLKLLDKLDMSYADDSSYGVNVYPEKKSEITKILNLNRKGKK